MASKPYVGGEGRVLRVDHALEDDRSAPAHADLAQVVPVGGLVGAGKQGAPHVRAAGQRAGGLLGVEVREGNGVVGEEPQGPARVQCALDDGLWLDGRRGGEAVAVVAFAVADRAAVDVDDQCLVAGAGDAVQHCLQLDLVRDRLEVEPAAESRGGGADVFHGGGAQVCQAVGDALGQGGTCHRGLALGVEQAGAAGGGEVERQRGRSTEQRGAQVHVVHGAPLGHERPVIEGRAVPAHRELVFSAAFDVVENGLGKALGSELAHVFHAVAAPLEPFGRSAGRALDGGQCHDVFQSHCFSSNF